MGRARNQIGLISSSIGKFAFTHIHLFLFIAAVLINYLPDIAPYYARYVLRKDIEISGTLLQFTEACTEPDQGEWQCRIQYRIPYSKFKNYEAVGLGIIAFSSEVHCANTPEKRVALIRRNQNAPVSGYLKTYLTYDTSTLKCDSDLIVSNWTTNSFSRYGYSQGRLVFGSHVGIENVKHLTELAAIGPMTVAVFLLLVLYAVFGMLGKISGMGLSFPPFDEFKFVWIIFIFLLSGLFTETLLPDGLPNRLSLLATNFLGMLAIGGPVLSYISQSRTALPHLRKIARFLIGTEAFGFIPLAVLLLIGVMYPITKYYYSIFLISICALCMFIALVTHEKVKLMAFFSLAGILDGLKVYMIPYLPASRVTAVYVVLFLAFEFFRHIRALEQVVEFNAGTLTTQELAHDIQSPLAALRILMPRFEGQHEEKQLANTALDQLKSIADSVLITSKSNAIDIRKMRIESVATIINQVIEEKKLQHSQRKIKFLVVIDGENFYVRVPASDFKRVLSNITNNAVESIEVKDGEVKLSVVYEGSAILVTVSDNGRGISTEDLKAIGNRGVSGKSDILDNAGSGLGLYLARLKIEQWGGSLEINSKVGVGTDVRIRLPRQFKPNDVV